MGNGLYFWQDWEIIAKGQARVAGGLNYSVGNGNASQIHMNGSHMNGFEIHLHYDSELP